jgi:hypothetical protein
MKKHDGSGVNRSRCFIEAPVMRIANVTQSLLFGRYKSRQLSECLGHAEKHTARGLGPVERGTRAHGIAGQVDDLVGVCDVADLNLNGGLLDTVEHARKVVTDRAVEGEDRLQALRLAAVAEARAHPLSQQRGIEAPMTPVVSGALGSH